MAISITCEDCHRPYKVDDKLAGKTVKCKGCGALIRVPGTETSAGDELATCLSCGTPMAPGNRICTKCGFNIQTGQNESLLLQEEVDLLRARKKRKWVRAPGSPLLESLDELAKLLLILTLVAGIVMTLVHIFRSTDGFSLPAILPTIVVLLALAGIVAPLAALSVNLTVRAMKLANRDDTYVRLALCTMLPFSISMIAGWPEMGENGSLIYRLGWLVAILLLIYMLRADVLEWIASVVAAAAAMALALIVVNLLGAAVNDIAGGMYADMLPEGPWTSLAKGHSPVPAPPSTLFAYAPPTTTVAIAPDLPPATIPVAPVIATTQDVPPAPPPPHTAPVVATAPATATRPKVLQTSSPYFAAVVDDPAIRTAAAVVVPLAPADWMLTVTNSDTTTEVDRWSLNPLEKKEHHAFPYFARKPAQFALAPRGEALAVLSFLPRRQLDVLAFDGKTTARNILLDLPANVPNGATQATPVLLGLLDSGHFYMRWDLGTISALQVFAAASATSGPLPWKYAELNPASDASPPALSPNAHLAAVVGRNQLIFATTDGTAAPRPILISSDASTRVLAVTFSPDSNNIAVLAAVADLPTVMAFQVKTGTPVFTSLLSQVPLDKDAAIMPHALVWLAGAQFCLVNGNDLVNTETGKKFGALGLTDVIDVQALGPSQLAITFKSADGGPLTILAKLDDEKLRAAKGK